VKIRRKKNKIFLLKNEAAWNSIQLQDYSETFHNLQTISQRFLERVHFLARANRFSARVSHGRFAILLAKA
jgi:hypothetical protein